MVIGALIRSVIRPAASRILPSASLLSSAKTFSSAFAPSELRHHLSSLRSPWIAPCSAYHSYLDMKFIKEKPSDKPRRKRASMRPKGPFAWVRCEPGEPVPANQPNAGSRRRSNEKKRMLKRKLFKESERKKRKVQMQEAKRKKLAKKVEEKIAAVARDKAWAERLVELKRIEEEKKAAMASSLSR